VRSDDACGVVDVDYDVKASFILHNLVILRHCLALSRKTLVVILNCFVIFCVTGL
jgi:hypothetical protein